MKKVHKKATPETLPDLPNLVSEPAMSYGAAEAMNGNTIHLMGMDNKKEFAKLQNENDYINLIRAGIPKKAMDNLMETIDFSLLEMANVIHTSDRTLRRYKPEQKLPQDQSERVIELARLYSRGTDVMGSLVAFRKWMETELHPFGNRKPKDYLDTSLGIRLIMDELGRIEHGIFV